MNTTANTATSFTTEEGITVTVGDRLITNGDILTVVRIAGRWVSLSNGRTVSRAFATSAREEYLEDEEALAEEIESEEDLEDEEALAGGEEIESEEYLEDEEALAEEIESEEYLEDEEALAEEIESHDIVRNKYRVIYVKTVSSGGNRTYDQGDELAQALRGRTIDQILGLCYSLLPAKVGRWDHLNAGQKSMNARNALRNAIKSGDLSDEQVVQAAAAL